MSKHNHDENTRRALQFALDHDKNLASYGLEAQVTNGEARISGVVDSLSEKQHASRVAGSVPGLRNVENGVTISTDGQITDSDVLFEVNEELNADPGVQLKNIGAEVSKGGVVTLVGTTDDKQEISRARIAAALARGVTKVVSSVKVESKEMTPEELFHSQVRNEGEKKRPN